MVWGLNTQPEVLRFVQCGEEKGKKGSNCLFVCFFHYVNRDYREDRLKLFPEVHSERTEGNYSFPLYTAKET